MEIIFVLIFFLVIYIPYIIGLILFAILIWVITTEKIGSKLLKASIILVVLLYSTIILGNFKSETPNDVYTEMKEINDNQNLIGLSKEEVIALLGEPKYEHTDEKQKTQYVYSAGNILKETYWGQSYSHDYYELNVLFDENDKVKYTYLKLVT